MTLDVIAAARRRTRRTVAVLVIVALVAVAVSCVASRSRLTDPVSNITDSSTVDAVVPPLSPPPGGAVVLPAEVTWVRVAGVPLPASNATGPAETVNGLASGFAHSLSGAVVAGLHLLVRTTPQVGPEVFDPTIARQVVGEDAALFRQSVTAQYTAAATRLGVRYGQPLGDLPAVVVGVRVESAEPDRVRLGVLTAAPDRAGVTRYAATSVTVVWVDDDWRLVAPPGGSWDAVVRLVDASAVAGYPPIGRG